MSTDTHNASTSTELMSTDTRLMSTDTQSFCLFLLKLGFLRDLAMSTDTHPTSTGTRHGSTDTHGLSTGTRPYRVPLNPFLLHFKSEDLSIDTRPSSTDTGLTSTGTQVASTDTHVKFSYLVICLCRVPVLIIWVSVLALKFEFRLNRKDIE